MFIFLFTAEKWVSYKVIEVVDSIISLYPNVYVNDVQNEQFCQSLRSELDKRLAEDNTFLQEIPMQFRQMLKNNNGMYIIKFECGEYTTNDKKLESPNSHVAINFAIFAEVDEDFASKLEDKAIYTVTGKYNSYVDWKLVLPSGDVFSYPTICRSYSNYDKDVCLGGFLFSDLQVIKK